MPTSYHNPYRRFPTVSPFAGAIKNFGRNIVGGAKIVGGGIKKVLQWPGKQIEKEFKMQDAAGEKARLQGAKNNTAYSGRPTFKYGMKK